MTERSAATMTAEMILALTIWAEAQGEPADGKAAVASVIWNRAEARRAKERMNDIRPCLTAVCLAPRQFSCWNSGSLFGARPSGEAWAECLLLARAMLGGAFRPSTEADHYHAKSARPYWAAAMPVVAVIGGHVFYKEV
jgi:spore germination cell wall hydrolase CwlJ-like protein